MKKNLYYGLMMGCFLGFSPLATIAQTEQVLERGDSLVLTAPDGYKSYKWQVSSDEKYFFDLPGQEVQELRMKVYAPAYYRVKVLDKNSNTTYLDTTKVNMSKIKYHPKYSISGGGHGFIESRDGKFGVKGIDIPEDRVDGVAGTSKALTKWDDGNAMAVYYINHPKNIFDTDMVCTIKSGRNVAFRISIWDPSDMTAPLAENVVAVKGTGTPDTIRMVGLKIPKKVYYRYQLECLKGWKDIIEISQFHHHTRTTTPSYKPAYLSSPSVHLNKWRSEDPAAPGNRYDWCYMEVMMPEESDIPGTYVMSLGVLHGYMGIQMNGYKDGKQLHDVIFSMWDDGDTDQNPDLPENLRSKEVDCGPGVVASRFGNEGTGIKSFKSGYNWDCGKFVQFITNCRPEDATYTVVENGEEKVIHQKNTLCSTWYNAQDGKGWQYMATLRLANQEKYFDSWYSFLENYNYPSGQVLRRAYYRNGYGHSMDQDKWYHFNQANFGNTDGGKNIGARDDFGQGNCDDFEKTYFMTTGGFIPKNVVGTIVENGKIVGAKVEANRENTPVDTINLEKLLARVDEAIDKEKKTIEAIENFKNHKLDKSNWEIVSFSSEETSGEGSNGRAAQIIDGDEATYWHSQWKGTTAKAPHYFVIDMIDEHPISGVQIKSVSAGGNRHIKDCNIYTSLDNVTWEKAYSATDLPDQDVHQFIFNQANPARYIKIEITKGYTEFLRINEVDFIESNQTGIEFLNGNSQFEVSCNQQNLLVKCPANLENAEISVYRTDGACIFNGTYPSLYEGEVIRIPMLTAPKGVYVVTCKAKNLNVSKQVMYNK